MLFGKNLHPNLNYLTTHYTDGPKCTHGGQKWKNLSLPQEFAFRCVYGASKVQKKDLVYTAVKSVTQQVVGCEHPPKSEQQALIGLPVRFEVDYHKASPSVKARGPIIVHSTALYTGPVKPRPPEAKKEHFMCACLTLWYRSEFLLEWVRHHQLLHGLKKVFIYDNDSVIDKLKDVVRLVNSTVPIDLIDWPQQKVQPAYMVRHLSYNIYFRKYIY